jgi:hypothetical protein
MTSFRSNYLQFFFLSIVALAATLTAAEHQSDAYAATAEQRALKITSSLSLTNPAHSARVRALIARHYIDLHELQAWRDNGVAAKAQPDKAAMVSALADPKATYESKLASLHRAYLARLAEELTPEQIDLVKDGHTYGVLPLTFRVYQQMLPQLTSEQKTKILALLKEAREQAMDAGTSKEKHAWFGKYKGKINNYLSAEGYNMKLAEKNLLVPR